MDKLKFSVQVCPICKHKLDIHIHSKKVDFYGKIWIFTYKCHSCGFKKSDILIDEIQEPIRMKFKVDNINDLYVRVIKSSYATLRLEELDYEITPGPLAEGKITNIEGILQQFLNGLQYFHSNKEKVEQIRETIEKVLAGEGKITIIIEDPYGQSSILSKKTIREKLS